jgi:hypothetical protein
MNELINQLKQSIPTNQTQEGRMKAWEKIQEAIALLEEAEKA